MSIKPETRQKSLLVTDIEDLVKPKHALRKLLKAVDFEELSRPLQSLWSKKGRARLLTLASIKNVTSSVYGRSK